MSVSDRTRKKSRPGPRPVSVSMTSRPPSMPIVALTDGEMMTASQSFHAAALSLLDEGVVEPESPGIDKERDLTVSRTVTDQDGDTAPDVDDTRTPISSATASSSHSVHDQDFAFPSTDSHLRHSNPLPITDVDFIMTRRASFPVTLSIDRESPDLDAVFEPPLPATDAMLISDVTRSRSSSSHGETRTRSESRFRGRSAVTASDITAYTNPDDTADYDGLLDNGKSDLDGLDIDGLATEEPPSPDTSYLMRAEARPQAPTPSRSTAFSTTAFTLIPQPDDSAPLSSIAELFGSLREQDSGFIVHAHVQSSFVGKALSEEMRKYFAASLVAWTQGLSSMWSASGNPIEVLQLVILSFISTLVPLFRLCMHLVLPPSSIAVKVRLPSAQKVLRVKMEEQFSLFDCLSMEQADAGNSALSMNRHTDSRRVIDLDAARLMLQLNALLSSRTAKDPSTGFVDADQQIRLSAASIGLEYVLVSELSTASSACCAAFFDLDSNWIVLAFKGESSSETDDWLKGCLSPPVHAGQHIQGFGRVRSYYLDRLFPRTLPPNSRMPYHTIIRTVRLISSQLTAADRIQLYFTGYGQGAGIASLAMAAALDARAGEFGGGVEMIDGYVFGAPGVCDARSVIAFNHSINRYWESPRVLWRIVNPDDIFVKPATWSSESTPNHHLGLGLTFHPPSKIRAMSSSLPQTELELALRTTPRLQSSLRPERTLYDAEARARYVLRDWRGLRGFLGHSLAAYWDMLRRVQQSDIEWR